MSIKFSILGLRIVVGCFRATGGPFVTVGNYSYSLHGKIDLIALERELGFRD